MSAITLGRINSKVFYVIEFAEIPIGNESYRSIMVENNIVIEMTVGILQAERRQLLTVPCTHTKIHQRC